jgi:hypothetical protein
MQESNPRCYVEPRFFSFSSMWLELTEYRDLFFAV